MAFAQGRSLRLCALFGVSGVLLLILLWLCAGRSGPGADLRLPATHTVQALSESDYPAQIENRGSGERIWAVRRKISEESLPESIGQALHFFAAAPELVASALNGPAVQNGRNVMVPLLVPDGTGAGLMAFAPPEYGDAMDGQGRPVRWLVPEHVLGSYSVPRPLPFRLPPPTANPAFAKALSRLAPARNASDYRPLVDSFAKRYGLNTNLVMAIIHSESNFVPWLVSNKSAMGLMQLLPSTASGEVHRFLYGTSGRVSFEQLSVPEINIRYGTAYLHILHSRYFAGVRDRLVREACVIAAYNMGPNGFLKLYGPTPEQAVAAINSMGHDEFLADLQRRLPMRETRFYVEKVRRMKEHYSSLR